MRKGVPRCEAKHPIYRGFWFGVRCDRVLNHQGMHFSIRFMRGRLYWNDEGWWHE